MSFIFKCCLQRFAIKLMCMKKLKSNVCRCSYVSANNVVIYKLGTLLRFQAPLPLLDVLLPNVKLAVNTKRVTLYPP
jgi:hypothetical protein